MLSLLNSKGITIANYSNDKLFQSYNLFCNISIMYHAIFLFHLIYNNNNLLFAIVNNNIILISYFYFNISHFSNDIIQLMI